jgi:uncharacterized spore protein YtfJ
MDRDALLLEVDMSAGDIMTKVRESMTVRTAIGEPVGHDGVVIVPAAKVRGGAGGSVSGENTGAGENEGSGAGFGMSTTPVGAFVIRNGTVSWRPAIDVNRVILGGQIVAIVALLTIRTIVKVRAKRSS